MKQTHILNIGYPKCGTTWLYHQLTDQPWFATPREKENTDLILGLTSLDQYTSDYKQHNITANFSPAQFGMDRYMISRLHEIETVLVSIIIRNPFELYWSLYNFLPQPAGRTFNCATRSLLNQGWFNRVDLVLKRWIQIFSLTRFKIFFYQDLCTDSEFFLHDYCSQMGLPVPDSYSATKQNVTSYQQGIPPSFDLDLVNVINNNIDNLQSLLDRDIGHWKR